MIFLALSQDSLSLMGLMPRSDGLSLMVGTSYLTGTSSVGGAGAGTDCLAVEEVRDVSEESKEVSRRDPAPEDMMERPPMDCPPQLERHARECGGGGTPHVVRRCENPHKLTRQNQWSEGSRCRSWVGPP
jgi:hypothetical protein